MTNTKKRVPIFFPASYHWINPRGWSMWLVILGLLIMLGSGGWVVYLSGGTAHAFVHILYIPILFSGFFFSVSGGLLAAGLAAIISGPWMPLDVEQAIQQVPYDWIMRGLFFLMIGSFSGMGAHLFRKYLQTIETQNLTHPLTGLPNLRGLQQNFKGSLDPCGMGSVIVIDIRNLNDIEQALGARYTEKLLKRLAQDLEGLLPVSVRLGHSHTSSFILVLPGRENLEQLLNTLRTQRSKTYTIEGGPVYLELAFGVASWSKEPFDLNQLVRKAKVAVESIREKVQDIAYYTPVGRKTREHNVRLLHELQQAIDEQQLILHYQPKISLESNQVVGVEALLRWNHPKNKLVGPDFFLPLAEETFLISSLTRWVFEHALQDLQRLKTLKPSLRMAVNVSAKNFYDPVLFEELIGRISKSMVPAEDFEIEVTESAIAPDLQAVIEIVRQLRRAGIRVSIDDFGTGQASQTYLYKLPLDGLKIDRSFIQSLGQDATGDAIVKSTILLAKELNLEVTAEGIETESQLEFLKSLGCILGQGYAIARPAPLNELISWLKKR